MSTDSTENGMYDPDELAGIVDLFGGLTREELVRAVEELAARNREDLDAEALEATIRSAIESFHLLEIDEKSLLVVGPAAFPHLPEGGEDLPHLLDIGNRAIDEATASRRARTVLEARAAAAIVLDDVEAIELLLEVSYDLEAWGHLEVGEIQSALESALT